MTATMPVALPGIVPRSQRVRRTRLSSAIEGKLYFAQVREDPLLEIDALDPHEDGTYLVVGSGGCTALSLVARGAGRVIAVDMSAVQNHIVELKTAAVSSLDLAQCIQFLGGWPMPAEDRIAVYAGIRRSLSPAARDYWDGHGRDIEAGVINAGVSERFIKVLSAVVRLAIHSRKRINGLLSCNSIAGQSRYYDESWNNLRWRALFSVLLNRWTMSRTYDPAFFANAESTSFSAHFHRLFERTIRETPVQRNYFLHHMLKGSYPEGVASALPPYLESSASREAAGRLEIVDGSFQDYLGRCTDSSVDGICLSNICEWLSEGEVARLFATVARVARPGAVVCFRNFVGYTEVPQHLSHIVVEDRERGIRAIIHDRSCVQSRIAICRVEKSQ